MRYILPLLLLLGGCGGCASIPSHSDLRATTLRLEFAGGVICSGVAIGPQTLMTAQHCMDTPLQAVNGARVKVEGIGRDKRDLATIKIAGTSFKQWARIGAPLKQGDRVRWFGNPAGLPNVYREGYVVRAQTSEVLIDARGFSGDSGAGIFDSAGRVVGVLTGSMTWVNGSSRLELVVVYPMDAS